MQLPSITATYLAVLALLLLWRLRTRLRDAGAFLAPIGLLSLAWLSYFYVIYGSIDPQVAYGAYAAQNVRFENLPRSLLGLLIDQKFGLLVYSPVYALAAVGTWRLFRDPARRGLRCRTPRQRGVAGQPMARAQARAARPDCP